MALLWVDGFDKYGDTDGAAASPAGIMRIRYHQQQERIYTYTGRFGGYAIVSYWDSSAWVQTPALTTDDTLIVGFSMYCPDPHNAGEFLQLRSAHNFVSETVGGIGVTLNADRSLTIKRGSATLASSSAGVVPLDSWVSFELKLVCDNTTGSYEVDIDGVDVLSATGVDTQHSTDSFHDVVRFCGAQASTVPDLGLKIDDFWVCDSTGSVNNDFLGSGYFVATISPNADGDDADWTPSTGNTHYTLVNEDVQVDTNYVEDDTATNLDLFEYESLPSISDIKGVQAVTEIQTTEPNAWTIKTVVKHSSTEDADAGQTVGTDSLKSLCRVMETNPVTTNAWTVSDVDNLQAGIEVG